MAGVRGSGRHPRDTVRVGCAIPRPVYEELIRRETESGIYRSHIIAGLVCEGLIGAVVDRELRAASQRSRVPSVAQSPARRKRLFS